MITITMVFRSPRLLPHQEAGLSSLSSSFEQRGHRLDLRHCKVHRRSNWRWNCSETGWELGGFHLGLLFFFKVSSTSTRGIREFTVDIRRWCHFDLEKKLVVSASFVGVPFGSWGQFPSPFEWYISSDRRDPQKRWTLTLMDVNLAS